jgi:hypothetical protein
VRAELWADGNVWIVWFGSRSSAHLCCAVLCCAVLCCGGLRE